MATDDSFADLPPDERADMEEAWRLISEGKRVTDPALLKRIDERSERDRRQIREKHGLLNIAVDLIREGRDEE